MIRSIPVLIIFVINTPQLGVPISTDRGSEAENDWQDGLAFVRQILRERTFVEDALKLRGAKAQNMTQIMQAVRLAILPSLSVLTDCHL